MKPLLDSTPDKRVKLMTHLTSINSVFSGYKDLPIFFEPLGGNNGDTLIQKGSISYFNSIGIKITRDAENSKVIVINGGGAINDFWKSGLHAIEKYSLQYPHIPLIVLPSSFIFQETDFASLFESRQAPVTLFARELYSLNTLKELKFSSHVRLGLDHDMAFQLEGTDFIHQLRSQTKTKHILIVERNDVESTTNISKESWRDESDKTPSVIKRQIPAQFRNYLNEYVRTPWRHQFMRHRGKMGANTTFAQKAHERVLIDYPALHNLPVYAADISDTSHFSFRQFVQLVAEAEVVVTTRLHVAILAALLNKPIYLKTGSYYKIRGIFEFSFQENKKNKLIDNF